MPPTLATQRLTLVPLGQEHLADYTALIAQPAVHRYLSSAKAIAADPPGQAQRIIELAQAQWRERGYGPFAVFATDTGAFVGRGGLFWVERLQAVEINYMLEPAAWGTGYATELSRRFLEFGFDALGLERMVATTNPDNAASQRVLLKVGMRPDGQRDFGTHMVDFFFIDRADWLAAGGA
ncbi:RimJ/RimL family protein N-acetyltransferase [Stella humosa]|uniref:RimJ/RimL family protein N-acetyltransferase n=1 Tax=Stella humosa TaxID=94 RepID=A0A3N1KUB9_9PROT|nr:GNAT family N-acetyltransferase [Stella humosa]ROP83584.1 RimJ/RimL family protein N-acetyltransferase [Stella humosa]BBK33144.1 acetyltransferase [Stella humosa]